MRIERKEPQIGKTKVNACYSGTSQMQLFTVTEIIEDIIFSFYQTTSKFNYSHSHSLQWLSQFARLTDASPPEC